MMKNKMYLITKEYPYGNSETAFIDPEYKLLSEVFDITFVVTELKKNSEIHQENNCILIDLNLCLTEKIYSLLRFLLQKDAWIEIKEIFRNKKMIFKQLNRSCMYGTFAEAFYLKLKRNNILDRSEKAIFYFYWWDYKCLGLTMHKEKYSNIHIIARTHGYDLYDERELYGRQYFKPQMDSKLDRLIFVSEYGKKYYLDKYGKEDSSKYPVHCLGVAEQQNDLSKGIESPFLIVSCSNVIPLKRIELIIEGLSKIRDICIKWVHFGDGTELSEMKMLAEQKLGTNIEYEFKGRWLNSKVIEYYRTNNVNCFITTTSTEGNPVSVQEALSFGIPIIATAVSDIPRMISGNGVLLSENPTGDEIAKAIKFVATMDYEKYIELRKKSFMIFSRDYNAKINHAKLISDISELQ